jgi:DNA-directed RNA polymerase subunit RPC12/RpoP
MKTIVRNKRSPRKYTPLKDVVITDDAGMVWATVGVRDGRISIDHLDGVDIWTNKLNGMGDYLIGDDAQGYRYGSCPKCGPGGSSAPKTFDQRTKKVKCSKCGHTWELKRR